MDLRSVIYIFAHPVQLEGCISFCHLLSNLKSDSFGVVNFFEIDVLVNCRSASSGNLGVQWFVLITLPFARASLWCVIFSLAGNIYAFRIVLLWFSLDVYGHVIQG